MRGFCYLRLPAPRAEDGRAARAVSHPFREVRHGRKSLASLTPRPGLRACAAGGRRRAARALGRRCAGRPLNTTFTLPNGLKVILHEDHALPIVSVNIWYHVGSGDEKPGRTGFAHLFEHMMFMGSQHVPTGDFDRMLEAAGADNNGSRRGSSNQLL